MPDPPLTIADLDGYIGAASSTSDAAFLQSALDSAIAFTTRYISVLPDPLPADLRDAILTLAARRYHERNAGYQDATTVSADGGLNYFKQLPASVKVILDQYAPAGLFLS